MNENKKRKKKEEKNKQTNKREDDSNLVFRSFHYLFPMFCFLAFGILFHSNLLHSELNTNPTVGFEHVRRKVAYLVMD
jgi:hypothetical protein